MMQRIANGEKFTFEVKHYHKNGKIIDLEVSGNTVTLGNENVFVAFHRDITERKKSERSLAEALQNLTQKKEEIEISLQRVIGLQATLVQSEKMASIGQLTAGIAHEINNPLSFINSNLNRFAEYYGDVRELLRLWQDFGERVQEKEEYCSRVAELREEGIKTDLPFIDSDFQELMNHAKDGIARIIRIVDQLRGFSHMATNDFTLTNINQTLDETLVLVWNEIKYHATVEKKYGEIPCILCNAGEMKQVFVNLLVNAGHAIRNKGVITLRTEIRGDRVEISVSDTGSGISPDNMKRIFDPFFTTKSVGKGTGLGLWIVSTIMDKHHGIVSVESNVDVGTTFTVNLPLKQARE